ncbi:hypothetical protein Tco_0468539 [Tanacetum coccineum]
MYLWYKVSTSVTQFQSLDDFCLYDNSDKPLEANSNDFASSDSSVKSSEPKSNDSTSCASTSSISTSESEAEIESNVGTPIQETINVQDLPRFNLKSFKTGYFSFKNFRRKSDFGGGEGTANQFNLLIKSTHVAEVVPKSIAGSSFPAASSPLLPFVQKFHMYVVPTGRVVVPTGRYVVPAGKVIIIVSPGRLSLVPTGRILSPGESPSLTGSKDLSRVGSNRNLLRDSEWLGRVVHCITGSMMSVFNINNHLCNSDSRCIDPVSA